MNYKKQLTNFILTVSITLLASPALATAEIETRGTRPADIKIVGLFKDAAVLNINDQRKLVRVGDNSNDVRLLAANSEKAMIEVKGKRYLLSMVDDAAIRVGLPPATNTQAHLISNGGMYSVTGSINQQLADFIVDTGASYVTMNAQHAKRLGLDYSNAQKVMMNTAKGKTTAHVFTIKSIRIGGIELNNVKAAVVHELDSKKMLLGMSFLNQVEIQQKNGLMILKKTS